MMAELARGACAVDHSVSMRAPSPRLRGEGGRRPGEGPPHPPLRGTFSPAVAGEKELEISEPVADARVDEAAVHAEGCIPRIRESAGAARLLGAVRGRDTGSEVSGRKY